MNLTETLRASDLISALFADGLARPELPISGR